MNPYLLALTVACGALWMAAYLWRRRHLYRLAWQLPGLMGYPLIGSAHNFFDATKVIDYVNSVGETSGNLSKFWMANHLFVYIEEPAHAEIVLNSPACLDKGASYRFIEAFLGLGLITSRGRMWRQHRKLLQPAFAYQVIGKFTPIINKHVRVMMARLRTHCGGAPVDVIGPNRVCSMDLICETTMDRVINANSGENERYLTAIHNVLEMTGVRMFNPLLQPDMLYKLSPYYKPQQQNIQICNKIVEDIIAHKIGKHKMAESEKPMFIDRMVTLMCGQNQLSIAEGRDETNTVLLAGYETTANTLSFVMLMLAMHPECQERVYDECRYIPPDDGADVSNEQIAELKYLDMFIKETLRLLPAVPFLTRTTTAEIVVGGRRIPPGVEIVINCMSMHRSPASFPEPLRFDPFHFLPEATAARHAYSFLPFSAGPRSCIGTRYAMNVLKVVTIHLTRNYKLRTAIKFEDLRFRMNITLNLITPPMITFEKR